MIAYVDSSVLLRFMLQQPGAAHELLEFDRRMTSSIAEVECLRAVDSAHAHGDIDENEWSDRRAVAFDELKRMHLVPPSRSILSRACDPLPAPLRALDAIHVATALTLRDREAPGIVFATHDRQQARAARAMGFEVLGV